MAVIGTLIKLVSTGEQRYKYVHMFSLERGDTIEFFHRELYLNAF